MVNLHSQLDMLQVQRRQGRAEAKRSCRQQHVLNRWLDGRAGRAGRGAAFEARRTVQT